MISVQMMSNSDGNSGGNSMMIVMLARLIDAHTHTNILMTAIGWAFSLQSPIIYADCDGHVQS